LVRTFGEVRAVDGIDLDISVRRRARQDQEGMRSKR